MNRLIILILLAPAFAVAGPKSKKKEAAGSSRALPAEAVARPDPAADSSPPPPGSSPMAELKRTSSQLEKLLGKRSPSWSPEAELQRGEVRKLVGGFIDYEELARRSLARHWDGIAPAQRNEFVSTLRELVERSYLKEVHGNPDYNLKFDKEQKSDREAVVTGVLKTTSRGKKVEVALEYKLIYRGGHWLVYDVVTDEQSLLENYRAEFAKIINKESFDALLKKMKKKLEKVE